MKPVVVRTKPGMMMEVDSRYYVTQTILMLGIGEPKNTEFIGSHLKPGAVFIDVGTHVGYYSLLASRAAGNTGKVVAVEPNPQTIARLERNIALNCAVNISVQKVAATDKET